MLRRSRLLLAFALALVPAVSVGSPEDNDEGFFIDKDRGFEADADADVYAGPAPLAVAFSARALNAFRRVTYHWSFDDGTTSTEQNPRHTFRRQGWYNVTVDARDAAGHVYRMNLLLHAWRPKDWARMQVRMDTRIAQRSLRELERKQRKDAAAVEAGGSKPTP